MRARGHDGVVGAPAPQTPARALLSGHLHRARRVARPHPLPPDHPLRLLLRESAGALQDVARQPKYLGGELGCLSVLHTWGRQLQYHPHVHVVVPAGGFAGRSPALGPASVAGLLSPAARAGEALPQPASNKRSNRTTPNSSAPSRARSGRGDWVADVQPAGSGEPALKYLSAYVYRTALSAQRIRADDGRRSPSLTATARSAAPGSCACRPRSSCAAFCSTSCPRAFSASVTLAG